MLKQEEALAELDASIDDWVTKLEQAENRRTRVRQKLLEHVAAAATLPSPTGGGVVGVSESLQLAMGIKPPTMPNNNINNNISTPPRSPTKVCFTAHTVSNSPSPQRVVAQVPSTILEQPLFEEAATAAAARAGGAADPSANNADSNSTAAVTAAAIAARRIDVESIRIYAGDDVYALLADVENEITKMSGADYVLPKDEDPNMSPEERRELHRAHSQELLNGGGNGKRTSPPASPGHSPAPAATTSAAAARDTPASSSAGEVFLTNAVFRPERTMLAI